MRRPITDRQLCAVARAVIEAELSIDDAEWKERVKRTLVAQGYDYPAGGAAALSSAIARVERALSRRRGPRPAPRLTWH